jgi:general secretion pathway protein A
VSTKVIIPHYLNALTSVIEGIKKRVRLISILGEPGTGKTTFIHLLRSSLGKKDKTALISYPLRTFAEILENILEEIGLKPAKESRETLLHQLHEYLLHSVAGDQTLVVIIDEAQNLSQELIGELRKLCDLEGRLQTIFVGQPELEGKLDSRELSQVRQKAETKYRIRPLSREESQEYIDHRLRLVGSSISEVFTPMAALIIVGYARGIPRVINILCDNALLKGYQSFTKKVGVSIVCEAINQMEGPVPAKPILARIIRIIRGSRSVALGVDLSWPRRYFSSS